MARECGYTNTDMRRREGVVDRTKKPLRQERASGRDNPDENEELKDGCAWGRTVERTRKIKDHHIIVVGLCSRTRKREAHAHPLAFINPRIYIITYLYLGT